MTDGDGWESAKQLITYRLDQIQLASEGIKFSVDTLSSQLSTIKSELAASVATKAERAELDSVKNELHELKLEHATEIAQLKVQAGIWGAIAGLVPVALTLSVAAIAYFVG